MRIFCLLGLLIACSVTVVSQESSQQSSQQIVAEFTKHKELSIDKKGVKKEKYKDVRSESVVKSVRDYAGVYEVSDFAGEVINIQVGQDGRVQANGSEKHGEQTRTFNIKDARIEGALLTGTKVYDNGATEKFEGVFMNRTERNSATDPGMTVFGLGVVLNQQRPINGNTYDKLFYQKR